MQPTKRPCSDLPLISLSIGNHGWHGMAMESLTRSGMDHRNWAALMIWTGVDRNSWTLGASRQR